MKLVAINVVVGLVAALVLLGAMELYLRLTVPPPSTESIYEYTRKTPRYKLMKADARIVAWGKELRTNRLGFRDAAAAVPAKRPGEFRIVVLGDSFTVSAGVDFRDIWTTRLEARLRERHPAAKVMNLAVGGYNIVQYAMVLEEVGLALEPDLVLVALFPENDFSMDTYELNRRVALGVTPAEPESAWYEELFVYRAYLGRVVSRVKGLVAGAPPRAPDTSGAEENARAFGRIVQLAGARGVPVAAVALPSTYSLEKQEKVFAHARRLCAAYELPCLDLLRSFAARDIDFAALRLNPLDAHPNARYNALVADEIARFLSPLMGAPLAPNP